MSDKQRLVALIPDPQDSLDYLYEWNTLDTIPAVVDLRNCTGVVENQLSVGSCTANALVGAGEMFLIANALFKDTEATDALDLSRLFNYKTARSYLPQQYKDNDLGSFMRCNLRAAKNHGICSEQMHPYSVSSWNAEPSQGAYTNALNYKIGAYYRIPQIGPNWSYYPAAKAICHAIASGFPVLIGMLVGEKFRALTPDQEYTYVNTTTNPSIGGHEMIIVGYTPTHFIIRNSWGKDWCNAGYFNCPQSVLINDAIDIWVVQGFAGLDRCSTNLVTQHAVDAVTLMYRQALHREPDAGGLAYWNTQTQRNAMQAICSSEEFYTVNHSISDLYRSMLGREPDTGGLNYWTSTRLPLRNIANAFMQSAEFQVKYKATL